MTALLDRARAGPDPRALEAAAAVAPRARRGLVLAVPKGRILPDAMRLLERAGIRVDAGFFDDDDRRLRFPTDDPDLDIVRVRSFDVATFVAYGGAALGVCGNDVLMEFDYSEIYAPVDLGIGTCRVSVAARADIGLGDPSRWSEVRVATKYPNLARRHFASRGIQAEIVHLNGAMELAPALGLARLIVDLVQTGSTLRANGLVELDRITEVSSRLIVNRGALKTDPERVMSLVARIRDGVSVGA